MNNMYKDTIASNIDSKKEEMLHSLSRLISIKSVEESPAVRIKEDGTTIELPYGEGVARALDESLAIAESLGFRTENIDYQCGFAEYGEGDEMVMVLGHIDVVPEAEGWDEDTPPYDPVIKDGKMFGRGTIDDKGPVIAALFALWAVAKAGIPLKRRVRIMFGCNEETGAADMKYYRTHGGEIPVMGFTPDGAYPLINGEKGIINEVYERGLHQDGAFILKSFDGGVAGNVTPDYAKAVLICPEDTVLPDEDRIKVTYGEGRITIEAYGKSAHGSTPELGENAISRLAFYLDRNVFKVYDVKGDAKAAIEFIADKLGDVNGAGLGCPLEDEVSGKFTCNLGLAGGDENKIWVRLNYRYPVRHEADECMPVIRKAFEDAGWINTYSLHKPKLYVPEDSQLVQTLLKVYREATGDMSLPMSIGGGTYAKAIPNVLAFGPIFPGDPVVEHLPNEYIEIDRLIQNANIIAAAIIELAKEEIR